MSDEDLLTIDNLCTHFYTYRGIVKALNRVYLRIKRRGKMGIVGETGCGKSVMALSILRLVPNPGKILEGEIIFNGKDLLKLSEKEMSHIRGEKISMIFQEPTAYINPVFEIGEQVARVMMVHQRLDKNTAMQKTVEMFKEVNIPDPEKLLKRYPHELSGGMLQRVLIAMALSCNPKLLIADEPTTFLDVTTQYQILELMMSLIDRLGSSVLLITHNLGVVAETCDEVAVMYAGNVVESAPVRAFFRNPAHPYAKGLLNAVPKLIESNRRLQAIPGRVPDLVNPPLGCRFHPRCPYAMDICRKELPSSVETEKDHFVSCHLFSTRL